MVSDEQQEKSDMHFAMRLCSRLAFLENWIGVECEGALLWYELPDEDKHRWVALWRYAKSLVYKECPPPSYDHIQYAKDKMDAMDAADDIGKMMILSYGLESHDRQRKEDK